VSLQPAAGAHGEMTAMLVAAAYFRDLGQKRTTVLIPDAAHGTNPASAAMAGFKIVSVKSRADGFVDIDDLASKLNDETAVFMITNPNTLGLFEPRIKQIAKMIHDAGGLVYLDGANMNAILGVTRPGDFGADMMHFNPHKTFSGPHGGGGPGAGPIAVSERLAEFLPVPIVVKDGSGYYLDYGRPKSIGRVRSFFGSVGVLVRMYCYIRSHGPEGLRRIAEDAVLNANYLLSLVKDTLPVPAYGLQLGAMRNPSIVSMNQLFCRAATSSTSATPLPYLGADSSIWRIGSKPSKLLRKAWSRSAGAMRRPSKTRRRIAVSESATLAVPRKHTEW